MIPTILLGKTIQKSSKLRGSGGSALPGLVIEKVHPSFVKKILGKLKYGVVVISGTNGKTTTTKITVELLEKQGLKVFTNDTGSNFTRGVISAIIKRIKLTGKFDYDIAILELDEAHAVKFAEIIPINYSLLLNVQRDQLDRFGEIDYTAKLLEAIATRTKKTVIINREDPRLNQITRKNIAYFGLSNQLLATFPSDDNLLDTSRSKTSKLSALVTLENISDQTATYKIAKQTHKTQLQLKGIFNAYNAAASIALVKTILPKSDDAQLITNLSTIASAFGRGETFTVNHTTIELFLVKNPSAFQLSLESFAAPNHDFMLAINDQFADGRDISWLWNVDFSALTTVAITSGTRAHDIALRLKYDEIPTGSIEPDLKRALQYLINSSNQPKRIFATYTAMLTIRKILTGKSLL